MNKKALIIAAASAFAAGCAAYGTGKKIEKKGKRKALESENSLSLFNILFPPCKESPKERLKDAGRFFKYSFQRITKGYCDKDVWNMYDFIQTLMPAMLSELKENRHGYPVINIEDTSEEAEKRWDKILSKMISAWRDSGEDTCSVKNPYEEEYTKALDEFTDKYGIFGEGLKSEEEKEREKTSPGRRMHFMDELPEYKDISKKHFDYERKLDAYREQKKNEAFNLTKKYFFGLWD